MRCVQGRRFVRKNRVAELERIVSNIEVFHRIVTYAGGVENKVVGVAVMGQCLVPGACVDLKNSRSGDGGAVGDGCAAGDDDGSVIVDGAAADADAVQRQLVAAIYLDDAGVGDRAAGDGDTIQRQRLAAVDMDGAVVGDCATGDGAIIQRQRLGAVHMGGAL